MPRQIDPNKPYPHPDLSVFYKTLKQDTTIKATPITAKPHKHRSSMQRLLRRAIRKVKDAFSLIKNRGRSLLLKAKIAVDNATFPILQRISRHKNRHKENQAHKRKQEIRAKLLAKWGGGGPDKQLWAQEDKHPIGNKRYQNDYAPIPNPQGTIHNDSVDEEGSRTHSPTGSKDSDTHSLVSSISSDNDNDSDGGSDADYDEHLEIDAHQSPQDYFEAHHFDDGTKVTYHEPNDGSEPYFRYFDSDGNEVLPPKEGDKGYVDDYEALGVNEHDYDNITDPEPLASITSSEASMASTAAAKLKDIATQHANDLKNALYEQAGDVAGLVQENTQWIKDAASSQAKTIQENTKWIKDEATVQATHLKDVAQASAKDLFEASAVVASNAKEAAKESAQKLFEASSSAAGYAGYRAKELLGISPEQASKLTEQATETAKSMSKSFFSATRWFGKQALTFASGDWLAPETEQAKSQNTKNKQPSGPNKDTESNKKSQGDTKE